LKNIINDFIVQNFQIFSDRTYFIFNNSVIKPSKAAFDGTGLSTVLWFFVFGEWGRVVYSVIKVGESG